MLAAIIVLSVALGFLSFGLVYLVKESREAATNLLRFQQEIITDYQNRLSSKTWQDYAQIQNGVQSPVERGENVFSLKQHGIDPQDIINEQFSHAERVAQGAGLDQEDDWVDGPTLG